MFRRFLLHKAIRDKGLLLILPKPPLCPRLLLGTFVGNVNLGQADAFSWAQTFMVSCVAVAWVVGMGRYAWGNTIFDSRYAAASVVALLGSYFVWELHGPPFLVPLGRMLFFTAAAGLLAANFQLGYLHGRTRETLNEPFCATCGPPSRSPGSLHI